MKKQTKLVAVLSTAALLAIGASMTSFAATGWAEEDGTWVYYNRDGERATDSWKKSGNNWYYLDSDGEMAIDQLIEDGDNYYYVDINGVMASNQWVAIENEDAGEDDEPEHYWYYFQANGKALTNGDNDKVSLKTINGKKYAFDDEGKMLYGWVDDASAERLDNTDGDGFKDADYYFGGEDDGAMTTGWLQIDITYDEAINDDYKYTAAAFNDDEDQTRWFYFKSNGKKIYAEDGDRTKDKTINGKKYEFDQKGVMTAEWSLDVEKASKDGVRSGNSSSSTNSVAAQYAKEWRYFNSVEDGARVSRGWFKVVAAEYLNYDKYNWEEHPNHFILQDADQPIDFGEGKKNIYALEGTEVLVQRNKEVQMAAHDFGKGRAVYISGVPYSFANSRTLYRAILWSAHSEDELHTWFSSNYNVEVHAYVKNGKYCVVNNTYEPQDTTVYTTDGNSFDLHLDANEIRWYEI